MDKFLNKVTHKISSTSKQAVKKTQDMAEISRLKAEIENQQELIHEIFCEIGLKYYQTEKIPGPIYEPLFTEINLSEQKIADYQEKITLMKGVRLCPQCGTEINARAIFCELCGLNVMQWKAEQHK
ncbi:MAG TPA: hypothetical protein DCY20_06330 [Firmicutes bacterium]|nr:hypothetical protein [Bacillota bacterium]